MIKRRSRAEIIVAILEASLKNEKKTRIMYRSDLNFRSFKKFFTNLINKGLIEQVGNEYRITDKGRAYLKLYKELEELLQS